jgi:hypothetical protein
MRASALLPCLLMPNSKVVVASISRPCHCRPMSTANRQITSEIGADPLAVIPAKTLGPARRRKPSSANAFTILPGSK